MPGDDAAVRVDEDRVGKAEGLDRRDDLVDLALRVRSRITRIGMTLARGR
jgi:hypothetical protein